MWELEIILDPVRSGMLAAAVDVAEAMRLANPYFTTEAIVEAFREKVSGRRGHDG